MSRRSHAIVDMLHTFASVSAFQTIGMVLMEQDGDRVNSVEEKVMVWSWNRVEGELVWFGRDRVCVGGEIEVGGSWREWQRYEERRRGDLGTR